MTAVKEERRTSISSRCLSTFLPQFYPCAPASTGSPYPHGPAAFADLQYRPCPRAVADPPGAAPEDDFAGEPPAHRPADHAPEGRRGGLAGDRRKFPLGRQFRPPRLPRGT